MHIFIETLQNKLPSKFRGVCRGCPPLPQLWCVMVKPSFFPVSTCQRTLPMVRDKPQHCPAGTFTQPNWPVCLARESNQSVCVCVVLCISLQALSCCISQKWWGSTYLCWRRARTTTPWRPLPGLCKTSALDNGPWVQGWAGYSTQTPCSVWLLDFFYLYIATSVLTIDLSVADILDCDWSRNSVWWAVKETQPATIQHDDEISKTETQLNQAARSSGPSKWDYMTR